MNENIRFLTTPAGEELAILPRAAFDDLIDAAHHSRALADYRAGGAQALTSDDMRALLKAQTPLAFWRRKRALTQAALAAQAGISQSYIAGLETGARKGDPALFKRLAAALGVAMEDIVEG